MTNTDKNALFKQQKQQYVDSEKQIYQDIDKLFDAESFIELSTFVSGNIADQGVVTGYGTIDGRLVYMYSQDIGKAGGVVNNVAAQKISEVFALATKTGAPIISILSSHGAQIDQGLDILSGIGKILSSSSQISGAIPQIAVITGPCVGSSVFIAGLCDFLFMTEDNSSLFLTGPAVTQGQTDTQTDADLLGSASISAKNGNTHFTYKTKDDCFISLKKLLGFLPSNNLEISPPDIYNNDDINRLSEDIISIIPNDNSAYDIKSVIKEITDQNDIFEVSEKYAENIVTCYAKLGGMSVGIIANQPNFQDGYLDIDAVKKSARFIRICDSFNIPIITFVDVPGFKAGVEQEYGGISVYGASLAYAYAEATVPKITIIVRRAFGSACLVMCAKSIGADLVFAYPTAQISVLPPETAAVILHNEQITQSDNPEITRAEKINEYTEKSASAYIAAQYGFIDDIIDPAQTRKRRICAIDVLSGKRDDRIPKKHGNMPV